MQGEAGPLACGGLRCCWALLCLRYLSEDVCKYRETDVGKRDVLGGFIAMGQAIPAKHVSSASASSVAHIRCCKSCFVVGVAIPTMAGEWILCCVFGREWECFDSCWGPLVPPAELRLSTLHAVPHEWLVAMAAPIISVACAQQLRGSGCKMRHLSTLQRAAAQPIGPKKRIRTMYQCNAGQLPLSC